MWLPYSSNNSPTLLLTSCLHLLLLLAKIFNRDKWFSDAWISIFSAIAFDIFVQIGYFCRSHARTYKGTLFYIQCVWYNSSMEHSVGGSCVTVSAVTWGLYRSHVLMTELVRKQRRPVSSSCLPDKAYDPLHTLLLWELVQKEGEIEFYLACA